MPEVDEILRRALSLDIEDRAMLAERLLESLDAVSEEEADRLWAEEAERRLWEYGAGRAGSVPAEQVLQKAERLLK